MLDIDISLLVVFVIVWILLFLLKKLYFKPVTKLVDCRNGELQNNLNLGQDALAKHEQNIEDIEKRLKSARLSARETKENFVIEAMKEKEKIITEIARECRLRVDSAKGELTEQVDNLKRELEEETNILSRKIEQRLLH